MPEILWHNGEGGIHVALKCLAHDWSTQDVLQVWSSAENRKCLNHFYIEYLVYVMLNKIQFNKQFYIFLFIFLKNMASRKFKSKHVACIWGIHFYFC